MQNFRAWLNNLSQTNSPTKKFVGVALIIIGFLALITPLTPGSWLAFVGLELLGVRLSVWEKIKNIFMGGNFKYKIVFGIIVIGLLVFIARIISPEDAWLCQNGQWIKHGQPSVQMPQSGCGNNLPVKVDSPAMPESLRLIAPYMNQEITSPLVISGQARGEWFFEASFPAVLTDQSGNILAQTPVAAQGDWMTQNFVPFSASLKFTKPTDVKTGFLILKRDNPSGLPQNDQSYKIPVVFK